MADVVKISVRSLVEFILRSGDIDNRSGAGVPDVEAMWKGSRLHRKIQSGMGEGYRSEVSLSHVFEGEGPDLCLEGRADGIFEEEGITVIDEIKGIMRPLQGLEEPVGVHLSQARCYACLYGCMNGFEQETPLRIRMSYGNLETGEMKYFRYEETFGALQSWLLPVLNEYRKWAAFSRQWVKERNASIQKLSFPFPWREGQKDVAAAVYRTIARSRQLFIQAPTGSGKTLGTTFPAVKALGEGLGERVFYLTARTIARTVAAQAFDQLCGGGLRLKRIILTAKEKICPLGEPACNPEDCPYAAGHYDRINDAVFSLLSECDFFGRMQLEEAAKRFRVCPFELSLDLSVWMDVIICDYNYVFHPRARLKRFFGEGTKTDCLFLIDEAHNLAERGRQMYSASLVKEDFLALKRQIKGEDAKLARALEMVNRHLLARKRELAEQEGSDWLPVKDLTSLPVLLMNLSGQMETFLEEHRQSEAAEEVRNLYFQILTFLDVADRMDETYSAYQEIRGDGSFMLCLYCVDPSRRLQECLDKARASIFFSATLLPLEYYRSLLSRREDDYAIYASSCFPRENLKVLIGRDTTSRYRQRGEEQYHRISAYIAAALSRKKGNYLVFFSSYRMLEDTAQVFAPMLPKDYEMVCQVNSMDEPSREAFLENFSEERDKGLVGFCVMGSLFSEGIDLQGERLIGVIIVGTALPQVCTQQTILKQYYDARGKDGFRYAYLGPGMNKVLQAAGRVIRTQEDRGVVLLLDERFARPDYKGMFPAQWDRIGLCTVEDVGAHLHSFWSS